MADENGDFFVVRMNPLKLHVGSIQKGSGVFYGNNTQLNWRHLAKNNEGFGRVDGTESTFRQNWTAVLDSDSVDSPYNSQPGKEDEEGKENKQKGNCSD